MEETAQEKLWGGTFGDEYHMRQQISLEANTQFFYRALATVSRSGEGTDAIDSVLELGAGTGANLEALRMILPDAKMRGLEINEQAAKHLARVADLVVVGSLLNYNDWATQFDLVFTKGVLIHIAPKDITRAYDVIYRCTKCWILLAEYYNPKPVEVIYRGESDRLWKRDFAGEMLAIYPELRLVDYGFVYHMDAYPQDDITWFLLEKHTLADLVLRSLPPG